MEESSKACRWTEYWPSRRGSYQLFKAFCSGTNNVAGQRSWTPALRPPVKQPAAPLIYLAHRAGHERGVLVLLNEPGGTRGL